MVCTILAIFDRLDETQARAQRLRALCAAGMVDIYSLAVISKDTGGAIKVNQGGDYGRVGAWVGVVVGSLIGMLGGMLGLVIGATAGALIGWWIDLKIVGVTVEIVDIVARHLSPGQSALVSELDGESLRTGTRLV